MSDNEDDDDNPMELGEFDVYVIDGNGDPVGGVKVWANFGTYYGVEAERTDEDGHVEFLIPEGFIHTASTVTLSVEGDEEEEYEVEDGDSFTLTYD
jgi:hypothetical protein